MWTRDSSFKAALAVCFALACQFALAPGANADPKFPKGTKFKKAEKLDFGKLLFKDTKFKDFKATSFDPKTKTETYDKNFKGLVKKQKGKDFKPVDFKGSMAKSFDKNPRTGKFDTEIVSLKLKGKKTKKGKPTKKLKLGLNPNMPSTGVSVFTRGQEPMLVDSFFDVFFELTVNNEDPIPERGGTGARYTLANVPEPASLGLLLAGLFGLSAYRRQLQRQKRERP